MSCPPNVRIHRTADAAVYRTASGTDRPGTGDITEIEEDIDLDVIEPSWTRTSDSFQLAVVVATFAEVLRDSPFADDIDLDDLEDEADNIADRLDIRAVEEFADLVSLADRFS